MAGKGGGDVEKEARHEGGRARVEIVDEDAADYEPPPKLFAGDARRNDEAAAAAARARGEPIEDVLVALEPKQVTGADGGEWRKTGGGPGSGTGKGTGSGTEEESGGGEIAAWGPPAPKVAEALRVLVEPRPWVRW